MAKIEVRNVYKMFGDHPEAVLPLIQDGVSKAKILARTGHTVGLDTVSISLRRVKPSSSGGFQDRVNQLSFATSTG